MRFRLWIMVTIILCMPAISFSAEKLIFALDLIRHGDRTPIDAISTVPYQWRIGLGQLTAEGMRQEFEMGRRFRKRYVEQTHLLPPNYQRTTMYVYSTDYERTLMSAGSLLMGLYPPGTGPYTDNMDKPGLPNAYQPIPVHSAPTSTDRIIINRGDPAEEKLLMQKYVYSSVEWQRKEAELKPYFQRWSTLTGFTITKLQHIERLGDTLFIHRTHKVPMPAGLSDEEIDTIIDTSDWVFMAEERPKQVANFHSRQVMGNIARFVRNASEQKSPLRFVLLSAHDSTIASALSFMGAPLFTSPPYASDLNFSMYESGARNYVVKITYNGKPVTIPACGGTVCTLEKFLEIAELPDVK